MGKDRSIVFRTAQGWSGVAVSGRGVTRVVLPRNDRQAVLRALQAFSEDVQDAPEEEHRTQALQKRAAKLLQGYFGGSNDVLALPLDLDGTTSFQRSVWQAARSIPYGETRSYGWIARRIGKPKAARAVGQAMGANPVPVLVP
jgi:methylated-DNA-[protein]-cysteine S-methyltransferase